MSIFNDIKANNVLKYFELLCAVPRGSYNSNGIADFLCEFAKKNDLKFYRDNYNNVVIYKTGTKIGDAVILQEVGS